MLIVFIFTSYQPLSAAVLYESSKPRKLKLVYGLVVKNRGSYGISTIAVFVPEIQDYQPGQAVVIKSLPGLKFARKESPAGVPLLEFTIDRLEPGQTKAFLLNAEVTISEIDYSKSTESTGVPDSTMKSWLHLADYFDTKSPALRAQSLVFQGEKNLLKRADKIYEHIISKNYTFSNSPSGLGVDRSYSKKHLNCSDAAALYVVMCRLCGIPARYVGGIFYSSKRKWYPLLHAWAEIYIPPAGWLPVDPTLGRLSDKNRRLCFAHMRNRYITLWKEQLSVFYIEAQSQKDAENLEVRHSIFAESL